MNPDLLLIEIEEKRQMMIELGMSSSFVDERVVMISDTLDKLLNKYQMLISNSELTLQHL